jgi:hypothetical protein
MVSKLLSAERLEPLRAALRALKATGPDGFEGLVAAAIEAITDGRLKLLQAGTQGGVDAVSDAASSGPRRAVQSKRYAQNRSLDAVGMTGELTEAVSAYPGLDVWIVPTTRGIAGQPHEALTRTADREGIAYLPIDWPRVATGIPPLAALCVADPALCGRWLGADLARELERWAEEPAVAQAVSQLRENLTRVDVGLQALADASAARLEAVFDNAGEGAALVGPSARFLHDHLMVARSSADETLAKALRAERLVAVLGDEGTGKTWISLKSLRQALTTGPPMVLCLLRAQIGGGGEDLIDAVVNSLVDLGERGGRRPTDPQRFWRRRLLLWARLKDRPRILVYLDGLDEGPASLDWNSWLAPAFAEPWTGLFQVVITSRLWEWSRRDQLRTLAVKAAQVMLGAFTEGERDVFLAAHHIDKASLATSVLRAALHPRTAFHIVRLKDELPDIQRLTREQLLLADYRHRGDLRSALPLTDVAFHALVARFGAEARRQAASQALFSVLPGEAVDAAAAVSAAARSKLERVLSDLVDSRWWQADPVHPERLMFTDEALPDAVGVGLASELRGETPDEVRRRTVQFLEPWGADDIAEKVLRMCAVILVLDLTIPDEVCEVVLDLWRRQPRREAGEDFWWRLHAVRIELFLRYCEAHGGGSNDFTLEWSMARAWEIYPEIRPTINARLDTWISCVPLPRAGIDHKVLNRDRRRQSKRAARLARHDPTWSARIGQEHNDTHSKVALAARILQFMPVAPSVRFHVLWAVTMAASGRRYEYDLLAWILRRAREPADVAAVETASLALQAEQDRLAREAGSLLLNALGTDGAFSRAKIKEANDGSRLRVEERSGDRCLHRLHPRRAGEPDRFLLADLVNYAARSDLELDTDLAGELAALAGGAGADDLAEWLEIRSTDYLPTLWRWAPERLIALLPILLNQPHASFDALAEAARLYLPFAPPASYPVIAAKLRTRATTLEERDAQSLRNLALAYDIAQRPFAEQISRLSANTDVWPERVSSPSYSRLC